jgi:hypothetical protein
MNGNSLIIQVITAAVAIGIVMTYIKPTMTLIRTHQDDIAQIRDEADRIAEVNRKLADLYAQVNNISQSDKAALYTYLPDAVDDVRVLKDIDAMARDAQVLIGDLAYGGPEQVVVTEENSVRVKPAAHLFTLSFQGSYEQFKEILGMIEKNNYPLAVKELTVTPTEGGLLTVKMTLVTYAHKLTNE